MANKKEAYLCLSAMLRARENKLLNNEKAVRMLDAASFEDAAKILCDCGYPDMSQMNAAEIEKVLAHHVSLILTELGNMSPDKELVDFFRIKYDYHNAKAIIKSEAMGLEPGRLYNYSGRINPEKLAAAYVEGHRFEMPELLGGAMLQAKSLLARTGNPQLADFVLDKAYFTELKAIADKLGSSFITGYCKLLIDSANLKSAVRTLRMGKDSDFMSEVLIPGGNVNTARIIAAGDKDSLAALYTHSALEKAAQLGGDALAGGKLTAFEQTCDNAVNAYLRSSVLVAYGPETVAAYIAAVEGEITAARMILTGRLAGITPEVIKERLRDLYA